MRKKNYKGRCVKKAVSKSQEVCRTYDNLQISALDALQADESIIEICCNVHLDSDEIKDYMTDFLCIKCDGDLIVRECVYRKMLMKPMTVKLLDMSREYWLRRGINDWGLIIDAKK